MVPAGGTVAIDFGTPDAYMHIDAASVEALELIQPAKGDGAPARGAKAKTASLFWWLNRTATACGMQLLKVLNTDTFVCALLHMQVQPTSTLLFWSVLVPNASQQAVPPSAAQDSV